MLQAELTPATKWWSSITTNQKEHIGRKILENRFKKQGVEKPVILPLEYIYPACSGIFLSLSETEQDKIRAHCEDGHGFLEHEEKEGKMMSE